MRFKQLAVLNTVYDAQTINYVYDALSRLLSSTYAGVTPTRSYQYAFDRSGNRIQQVATIGGTPTTTNYTYNNANQLTSGGAAYDANGNLTNDGANAHTWDRANRLLSMGGASHTYDGVGNRVKQTVGATVTKYLLDLQPGLSVVLSQDVSGSVTRHIHAVRGIHAHKDAASNWEYMAQDGLGSVRSVTDTNSNVLWNTNYDGYGNPFGAVGTQQTLYGFTGEIVDGGGLLDVRARRYNPALGILPSLDPFEGVRDRAMSLNGYSWVEGNVVNAGDPSGYAPFCGIPKQIAERIVPPCGPRITQRSSLRYTAVIGGIDTDIRTAVMTKEFACLKGGYPDSGCKPHVADLLGWVWNNGNWLGQRATLGFLWANIEKVDFTNIGVPAQAGDDSILGVLLSNFPGRPITVRFDESYWGTLPDHVFGAIFSHEMEHGYWDRAALDTPARAELGAYLLGYLYLLEVGLTHEQIQDNVSRPSAHWENLALTSQIGYDFCVNEPLELPLIRGDGKATKVFSTDYVYSLGDAVRFGPLEAHFFFP